MKPIQIAACAVLCLASAAACAQQNTIRVGIADITIHSSAPNLSSNGPAFLTPQPAGVTVGDATTLLLAYTRSLDAHWEIDFEAGIPPRHDTSGQGTLAPFGVVAHVKQVSPALLLNYKFGAPEDRLRPFIGAGVNYTHFYDGESTSSGNLASGGPTRISLSDSFGWAAQLGLSYRLTESWSLVGSVLTAKVKSDMTAVTGSIERKTTIDFRPVVYTLGLAYSF